MGILVLKYKMVLSFHHYSEWEIFMTQKSEKYIYRIYFIKVK